MQLKKKLRILTKGWVLLASHGSLWCTKTRKNPWDNLWPM